MPSETADSAAKTMTKTAHQEGVSGKVAKSPSGAKPLKISDLATHGARYISFGCGGVSYLFLHFNATSKDYAEHEASPP